MTDHPLQHYWDDILADLENGLPDVIILPKGDFLRFCQMAFFQGVNGMGLAVSTMDVEIDQNPDPKYAENRRHILTNLLYYTSMWVGENRVGTLPQLLATVEAHTGDTMPEIVKVQPTISPPGNVLIYGEGKRNARTVPISDDLQEKLGDAEKLYFHATWTGQKWFLRDRAPDQPW